MAKKKSTTNIIVLGFDSLDGAKNMLENVHLWEELGFFTIKDAVLVTRGSGDNQLEIKQTVKKTGKWALGGGGIGFLAGMLLGGPIGGLVVGATIGAISGALKDSGIDDNFIHVVGTSLRGDTSALLVMVEPNPNRDEADLIKELSEQRATVLSTSLAPEREQQLRSLLSGKASTAATRAPAPAAASSQPTSAGTDADMEASTEPDMEAGTQPVAEATTEDEASTEDDIKATA
jgi:uncharacterized membrane protein